jgi:hypothetical protein
LGLFLVKCLQLRICGHSAMRHRLPMEQVGTCLTQLALG